MAAKGRDACSTFLFSCQIVFSLYFVLVFLVSRTDAGHHNNGQGGLEKLLAAGLIAKALAKGGEEGGGGGGGHHYMPIPIPIHSGGGGHHHSESRHHHVHHKYVPIPVKHHTNFIIAHHRVPVPVHVPVPVVKTKLVHVPVERTKIVPIIVHKGKHTHPHTHSSSYPHLGSPSNYKNQKIRIHTSSSSNSGTIAALASGHDTRQLRITSLGTVRKMKNNASNGTSIQFHKSSSGSPDKWIVVVKNKRRQPIRRLATDSVVADTNVIPRAAVVSPSNSTNTTLVSPAGPR